jgi:hypothetical protein
MNVESLLGKPETEHEIRQFLNEEMEPFERTHRRDTGRTYYASPTRGLAALFTHGRLDSVFFYVRPKARYVAYTGERLRRWSSLTKREAVRKALDEPERSGQSDEGAGQPAGSWDRFRFNDWALHVEYDPWHDVVMLTVMRLVEEAQHSSMSKQDAGKDPRVGRVSRFRDAVAAEGIAIVFIPSLVSVLLAKEEKKGTALTREEVLEIRDNAGVATVPASAVHAGDQARGYRDLDPARCWEEWLAFRAEQSRGVV